jgi:hypothetical protein
VSNTTFAVFVLIAATAACARPDAEAPAAAADVASALPDWSGWWGVGSPLSAELEKTPAPWKPEYVGDLGTPRAGDEEYARTRYCRPPGFSGYSGGFVESVEFLFTPGRVTITNESGLIRRIYTGDAPRAEEADESNTGTSIGRWDGQTLVVETRAINPTVRYPGAYEGAVPVGRNVRITERISLRDRDTLQFEIVTHAPDIFTAVDRRTRLYNRVPKQFAKEITFCTGFDRAIDPLTGNQRFDLTPPPDLPPPPG